MAFDPATDPAAGLHAVSRAYLDYSNSQPGQYRVTFGGLWDAAAATQRGSVDDAGVATLGQNVLTVFADAVRSRTGGDATVEADAVVMWVSPHGYAHQRFVARSFPRPPDFTERVLDGVTGRFGP